MKDYKKYFIISASPEEVYIAITNPLTIKMWTDQEAQMSTIANTEFSIMDESIIGKNIEFIENKKVVQEWYFGDTEIASIVTIKIHAHGDGNSSSVELKHSNIPDEAYDDIVEGWNSAYFGSLQDFFS
jgi:activator of HSP90 ATPase